MLFGPPFRYSGEGEKEMAKVLDLLLHERLVYHELWGSPFAIFL
jgi:hypothetical protein